MFYLVTSASTGVFLEGKQLRSPNLFLVYPFPFQSAVNKAIVKKKNKKQKVLSYLDLAIIN